MKYLKRIGSLLVMVSFSLSRHIAAVTNNVVMIKYIILMLHSSPKCSNSKPAIAGPGVLKVLWISCIIDEPIPRRSDGSES